MKSNVTLKFLGAARTVTGSRFLLRSDESCVMVDAGLFQGLKELRLKNWDDFSFPPRDIDAVVLTHAHLDHCGYLPRLVKQGFRGKIYMTEYTAKLAAVVLRDSAKLQMEDADFARRKGFSRHKEPLPLYTDVDVEQTIDLFETVPYRHETSITKDTAVTFYPCGHVLGASFVSITIADRRVLFTGDLGRSTHPLLRAPDPIPGGKFDAIITESTYGDRTHTNDVEEFPRAINRALNRGGSVLIPAFAVDRTEVILMELRRLMDEQVIKKVPIYADSPMALTTLNYYREAIRFASPEIRTDMVEGYREHDPFSAGTLKELRTVEDSKSINNPHSPGIIISASGMATGGRVVHHLEGMLPNPKHAVVLVGFQAMGTRGRQLVDGAEAVKMYGKYVPVRAEISQVGAFSVHADTDELLVWLSKAEVEPTTTYVVHGEESAAEMFASKLSHDLGWLAVVPNDGEQVTI